MKNTQVLAANAFPQGGRRIIARMAVCIVRYYSKNGKCSEQDLIRSGFTLQQIKYFQNIATNAAQENSQQKICYKSAS